MKIFRYCFATRRRKVFVSGLLLALVLGFGTWKYLTRPLPTIADDLKKISTVGEKVKEDLQAMPSVAFARTDKGFEVKDDLKEEGIKIQNNSADGLEIQENTPAPEPDKEEISLEFPKNYADPIEVKLPGGKSILISDNSKEKFSSQILANELPKAFQDPVMEKEESNVKPSSDYLKYSSGRKSIYYSYQKDGAMGERKLKNWLIYEKGTGQEQESYTFQNARLELDGQGQVNVFFDNGQEEKNQQAMAEVDPDLMERARKAILEDAGKDITKQNQQPDFTIPQAYYLGKDGNRKIVDWKIEDGKTLKLEFSVPAEEYPLAIDPTLKFTAPGTSAGADVITGEGTSNRFGYSLATGDLDADGKTDLAVGAYQYNTYQGRAYIFLNDGSMPVGAASADTIITGEGTWNDFGISLATGDLNADGKTDLAIGASNYNSQQGRAYIFLNDGSIPTSAGSADIIITGEGDNNRFGYSLATGDLNADGKTDLAVGAYQYNAQQGRAYIFLNDGSIPTSAGSADTIITGETNSYFGSSLTTGDLNADGKTDIVVGADHYSSYHGRVYIFLNDGSMPTSASSADTIITGEGTWNFFGISLATGDLNADGKTDLAVGAYYYNSYQGRAYIFLNDGSYPASAASADTIITGEGQWSAFGISLATGDLNADGKTDLVVGAVYDYYYYSYGRVYIFLNDGSIPTSATSADTIITGEGIGDSFGWSLATGDLNADGKTDLAVGADNYNSNHGRAYIFTSQNGVVNGGKGIEGEASSSFGISLTTGDLNADGKTDLAVGAYQYNSYQGRAYIFLNDGSIPTSAASADTIITGEGIGDCFGWSLATGDLNADGKTDLAVGASDYNSYQGRAYIFLNDGSIPTSAASADTIITGETSSRFGISLTTGDLNADGKTDLAVGAYWYNSFHGRAYIFLNDGSIPTSAASADTIITGEGTWNFFGISLTTGDLNADGKTDLAVGASSYNSFQGRAYIFLNDGSYPAAAASADTIITGEASSYFGYSLTTGDLNADGKTDLAVGADWYNSYQGRAYIFLNDGSIPTSAASADTIITGEGTSNNFGYSLTTGDLNADGKTDLAVGASDYNSYQGRAYIFLNDGSIPTSAASADTIITGEASSSFGISLATGDLNADGKTDLAVGAYGYNSGQGKIYFYSGQGKYATTLQRQPDDTRIQGAAGQEMKITGVPSSNFGSAMTTGDFNADGRTDLAVGAYGYNSSQGRIYIFYNDGSIPISAYSPDVVITGETGSSFGYSLTTGDLNADGKTDLIVGAYSYGTRQGRVYIFYQGNYPASTANASATITGENNYDQFGWSLITGDLNADGKTDLVVGATEYFLGSNNDHVYIFYNGNYPSSAVSASAVINGGEHTGFYESFGYALAVGDFNSDGKTDLAVGATGYPYGNSQGRVYIFYQSNFPAWAASADAKITGEANFNQFGVSLASGDFNADGKTDLAVGSYGGSGFTYPYKVYIFYQSNFPASAASASAIINGENNSDRFGFSLAAGDFNNDGKTDLAVGANGYPSNSRNGRAYIFLNDGSYPTAAASADTIITGEGINNNFGFSLATGDLNADGKTDLAVGAYGYNSYQGRAYIYTFNDTISSGESASGLGASLLAADLNADGTTDLAVGAPNYNSCQGRVYLFWNKNGSLQNSAANADKIITGENTGDYFGISLAVGNIGDEFSYSGATSDLAVGAYGYNSYQGRAYIFLNDGSIPTSAASADTIITGETSSSFGSSLATGDLNADGKTDLAVGAHNYISAQGRAYIFLNDGSIPTSAASADTIITGETSSSFGSSLATGDLNADGKTDLAVGAFRYNSWQGRAYIFLNDGSIPTAAASADTIITGEGSYNYFGYSLATGDLNADGKTDLAVGAFYYNSGQGRAYIFLNDGSIPTAAASADTIITGEGTDNYFSVSFATGDLNADGKTDLAVGASNYNSGQGRAYIFLNDGSIPTAVALADTIITGEGTSNYFGSSLATGDLNADGKTDLAVGAAGALSNAGKFYVIISEVAKATEAEFEQMQLNAKARGNVKMRGNVKLR